MKKPRDHSALIKQWADGAIIQSKYKSGWIDVDKPSWLPQNEYRVKTDIVLINGIECPKPEEAGRYMVEVTLTDRHTLSKGGLLALKTSYANYAHVSDASLVYDSLVVPFGEPA